MFASFEEAVAHLEDFRGLRQGQLRVGSYGPFDVAALVTRYRKRFPMLSISVDFGNSRILAEKLLYYDLDVAVSTESIRIQSFEFCRSGASSGGHRAEDGDLDRTEIDSVEELTAHTLVCREPGSATRAALDRLVGAAKLPPHRLVQFGAEKES